MGRGPRPTRERRVPVRLRVRLGVTVPEPHPVPVLGQMPVPEPQPARERQRKQRGQEEDREDGSARRHCGVRGSVAGDGVGRRWGRARRLGWAGMGWEWSEVKARLGLVVG